MGLIAFLCLFQFLILSASNQEKNTGLKIFISADIEGVAGVVNSSQTSSSGEEYQKVREWMTDEVLAAIAGAKAAGAVEFVVADSHGSMLNLLPDKFGPETQLMRGWARPLGMMQGIDSSFDAVIFIGYHAQAGTEDATIAHTISGSIYNLRINGVTVPEAVFNALVAGHFGVPVAMISGDKAVAEQAKKLLGEIETAEKALRRLKDFKPFRMEKPYKLEVEFTREAIAEVASWIPGIKRESSRTISYTSDNLLQIIPLLRVITRFIDL